MTVGLQQIAAAASMATGKTIVLVVKNKISTWINASDHTVADPAVPRQAGVACCFCALPLELRNDIYDRYFDLEKALRTTESGAERPSSPSAIRVHGGVGRRYVEKLAMNREYMKNIVASITEEEEEDYRLGLGKDELRITYGHELLSWGSEFTIRDLLQGVRKFCERLGSLGYDGFEDADILMREWLQPTGWGVRRPKKYDKIVDELVDMVEG
ncbi:hypothetical protein LTS10_010614 [Elasticomyces elasticus]|nr:hypothetical protein LTS10_010614 [Elasticomyces elasticus]